MVVTDFLRCPFYDGYPDWQVVSATGADFTNVNEPTSRD